MSDVEASTSSVPRPEETVQKMKMRHANELKIVKKTMKGKPMKDREAALEISHARELAELTQQWVAFRRAEAGEDAEDGGDADDAESAAPATAAPVPAEGGLYAERSVGQSKQKKKAAAREAREAEQERATAAAAAAMPDRKAIEAEQLAAKLAKANLFEGSYAGCAASVRPIRADGHCMFGSIADQLTFYMVDDASAGRATSGPRDAAALRVAAVEYMRAHRDDYVPFLVSDSGDIVGDEGADDYFTAMAQSEGSVQWGGQPELMALAAVLRRDIVVHQADGAPIRVSGGDDVAPLHLSLHQHAAALGAHYNSVVPLLEDA